MKSELPKTKIFGDKQFHFVWQQNIDSSYKLTDIIPQITKLELPKLKLLLIGTLGAGKTTFSQVLLTHLGVVDNINSPTFNLINYYQAGNLRIVHADFYRLNDEEELNDLTIYDDLNEPNLVLIEWGDKFNSLIEKSNAILMIDMLSDTKRKISFYQS